jgi:thiamine kinase-like enzyme
MQYLPYFKFRFPELEILNQRSIAEDNAICISRITSTENETFVKKRLKNFNTPNYPFQRKMEFIGECVNYLFLNDSRVVFEGKPRLVQLEEDYMLLEDLGQGVRFSAQNTHALAKTIADLHNTTAPLQSVYTELWNTYKPLIHQTSQYDERKYSLQEQSLFFDYGRNSLLNYVANCQKFKSEPLQKCLASIKDTIDTPSEHWLALIHDDLISTRQFIVNQDKIQLIDWETAKFAHRLRELGLMLTGRLERDDSRNIFHNKLGLTDDFIDVYKAHSNLKAIGDEEWKFQLSAALMYNTVVNIGVLSLVHLQPATTRVLLQQMVEATLAYPNHTESHKLLTDIFFDESYVEFFITQKNN